MGKAQRPSWADIRAALGLFHETCELGDDPARWRTHLALGLCDLVNATGAFHDEEHVAIRKQDSGVLGCVIIGFESAQAQAGFAEYDKQGGFNIHPFFPFIYPRATRPWTLTRRQIVPDDRDWYGTTTVSEYQRSGDFDDTIHSRQPIPRAGWANMVALKRGFKDKPFTERERRLAHLVHSELGRGWRRVPHPDPADALPMRLRDVVHGLRLGEAEKQIARRLGLTTNTIHSYVKQLYRRLNVSGRHEALAAVAPLHGGMRARLSFELPRPNRFVDGDKPAFLPVTGTKTE